MTLLLCLNPVVVPTEIRQGGITILWGRLGVARKKSIRRIIKNEVSRRKLSYTKAVKLIGPPEICALCGFVFPEELKKPMTSSHLQPHQPTIEHKVPRSRGGDDTVENIRWACYHCNQKKGDD